MAAMFGEMMHLGDPGGSGTGISFGITSAAYAKMQRMDEWRWVTVERLNNVPAEQFIGRGSTTIEFTGVIFAMYQPGEIAFGMRTGDTGTRVGTRQLEKMREVADGGKPLMLTDGRGNVLGKFVITKVHEEADNFIDTGAPRRQLFRLELRSYGDDGQTSGYVKMGYPPPEQGPFAQGGLNGVGALAQAGDVKGGRVESDLADDPRNTPAPDAAAAGTEASKQNRANGNQPDAAKAPEPDAPHPPLPTPPTGDAPFPDGVVWGLL